MNKELKQTFSNAYLCILSAIGLLWVYSGWEKVSTGEFSDGMSKTLGFFASKNPYPFYKQFLLDFAIPNAKTFGELVQYGEIAVGLGTLAVVLALITGRANRLVLKLFSLALVGTILLNANFWFASGWTSISTSSLNLLMGAIEAITLYFTLVMLWRGGESK